MNSNEQVTSDIQHNGISMTMTSIFILGVMAGSGILALPKAIVLAGWVGIPMLFICGILSTYTGMLLGKCWNILCSQYPEYKNSEAVTDPYPIIGFEAAGRVGRISTRASIIATQIGAGVVFMLLISGNLSNIVESLNGSSISGCYWILIVALLLIPMSWLGTPKDFWWTAIVASVTTTIAALLIVINLSKMEKNTEKHSNPTFASFFTSFGTILYAFGGSTCFPTLQVDMKEPAKFPQSVIIGLFLTLCLYIPVSVTGFVVIGNEMNADNILDELEKNWFLYIALILITLHLFMAFVIVLNPVFQDLEGMLKISNKFCWQRCLLRTGLVLLMLFIGLSIPHFGIILSLVGGVCTTATNFVFPPLFYLMLTKRFNDEVEPTEELLYSTSSQSENLIRTNSNHVSLFSKMLMYFIVTIGVVGGVATLYSVFKSLIDGSSGFTVPCYVNMTTL